MSARLPASATLPPLPLPLADEADADAEGLELRWVTSADGTRLAESVLALQGLYCGACAGLIEAALVSVPGVDSAEVNGASKRALVRWRPGQARAAELVEAVEKAGYGAFPAQHE